jgi:hypothetical protein
MTSGFATAGTFACTLGLLAVVSTLAHADMAKTETVAQSMCRIIDQSAKDSDLPRPFLVKLIWQESRFHASAISPAGAQGVAQFMPGTAAERGLADPFDPEQAIPHAARLLADLAKTFGNLGLAAAAYNGGPGRVTNWLQGRGGLPAETRNYVAVITGQPVENWTNTKVEEHEKTIAPRAEPPCLEIVASLRKGGDSNFGPDEPYSPWGVQLAGSFSKQAALATFARSRRQYAEVVGDVRPMIIGTRLRSRGTRAFYRVRIPKPTRQDAQALCQKIHAIGGACVVLRT